MPLHRIVVHVIAEAHRHAGHADIVRELIDGATGPQEDNDNMAVTSRLDSALPTSRQMRISVDRSKRRPHHGLTSQ